MELELISNVRFLGMVPMFALVVVLALKNRGKIQSPVYNRSRWLLVAATLLLSIHFLIQYVGHFREESTTLSWTVNMAFFIVFTPLYNMAELNLLRAGYDMASSYWRTGLFVALCYIVLAVGFFTDSLVNDARPWMTATFVVALLYFIKLFELSWILRREMRVANARLTDQELAERHDVLRYTARVMNWMILFSFLSPWVGMSSSLLLNAVYGIVIFLLLLGFLVLFLVYGSNMAECIKVNDEIAEAAITEAEKQNREACLRIEQWIAERRFTDPDVSISSALKDMELPATALNLYLEQHSYVGNSRQWLTHLRIEEAKRVMLLHPGFSLDTVAVTCGYANKSNLSRAFKSQEGTTPGQWISAHRKD